MANDYCVYMHISPNGKKYVGITCCRPRNRRWQNGYGYVSQTIFYRAIKKYGWDNFQHIILEDNLTAEVAGELEKKYIALFRTTNHKFGYNMMIGGEVGYHLTNEHKEKISRANSGSNNGMYGHHYSDEDRKRMSETSPWLGRKHTEESRKKMSEYRKAHPGIGAHYGKEHPAARAVLQYDMNGVFLNRYDTAAEASKKTGTQRSGICSCAKGKKKTSGGYIWRYQSDEIEEKITPPEPYKYNPLSANPRKRKINQFATDGEYIRTFESVSDASRITGKSKSQISAVARGERKTAGGYIWKYAE